MAIRSRWNKNDTLYRLTRELQLLFLARHTEGSLVMFSLFDAWYNYCRKHSTIKTTPTGAAGLDSEDWTLNKLLTESARARAA